MAVSYVTQKCTSCAGTKLEYIKELKSWKCLYCGTLIERHEQADSLFTIKNVVRQCLIDIAYKRMDSAEKNLVECKKIDSYYVGTYICETAYYMNMIVYGALPKAEMRNCFGQMKKSYLKLRESGDIPGEEEIALYEFLDSAEAYGVLILVYDSLDAIQRRDALLGFFEASEVYSIDLNTAIINFAIKNEKYDILDAVIKNTDNINKKAVLRSVAEKYPDNENKPSNMTGLINSISDFDDEDKHWFEKYFSRSQDSANTKGIVAEVLSGTAARPSVECIMENVVVKLADNERLFSLMQHLIRKNLSDREVNTIVEYAINDCPDESCLYILDLLKKSELYVVVNANQLKNILSRNSGFENRLKMLEKALDMNVSDKDKEQFIAMYLCEVYDEPESRMEIITFLFKQINTLSSAAIEKYLTTCTIDSDIKPDIVKKMFDMEINRSFLRNTLGNYLISMSDEFKVKCAIVRILSEEGLQVGTNACVRMLMSIKLSVDQRIALYRELKYVGMDQAELAGAYLTAAGAGFDSQIFAEILDGTTRISVDVVSKYTLNISDHDAAKISAVKNMIEKCGTRPNDISVSVRSGDGIVSCSLPIGYLLCTPDNEQTSLAIVGLFDNKALSSNSLINVSGSAMKLGKYLSLQNKKGQLREVTRSICKKYRLL